MVAVINLEFPRLMMKGLVSSLYALIILAFYFVSIIVDFSISEKLERGEL